MRHYRTTSPQICDTANMSYLTWNHILNLTILDQINITWKQIYLCSNDPGLTSDSSSMSSNVPPRIGCESASRCDFTLTTLGSEASWMLGSGVGSSMSLVRSSSSSYIALRRRPPGVAVSDRALHHVHHTQLYGAD